ncbi:hypothetical protein DERP_014150 [Dermatophagoides pteronyssinus]|uniref:Uncharacterized protein n=1 Tax=Dermatophagoides pteronyssinus TaxID=6956 RepID=A0ABQ8IWH8_DERPT|nr:hypothetical protein DERP_014150 [Dermatophagoides pteronyssinus]
MNNLNDTQDLIESQYKMIALFEVLFAIERYIRDPDPAIIAELEEKTLELPSHRLLTGITLLLIQSIIREYILEPQSFDGQADFMSQVLNAVHNVRGAMTESEIRELMDFILELVERYTPILRRHRDRLARQP